MRNDETSSRANLFASLIRHAESENWCMKLICTTCGTLRFRDEVKKIGIERIVDSMYSLNEEEIEEILEVSGDPIGIVERDVGFQYQGKNLWREEKPPVMLKREAIIQAKIQRKNEKREKTLEVEAKNKAERQAARIFELVQTQEQRQITKQQRERIIAEFTRLNLQEKLRMIAEDKEHLPDYYPLQMEHITAENLQNISSTVIEELIDRLSLLKSNRWNNVRKRLNEALPVSRTK